MTGFNLPPGCNVSDIPGHRPEDIAYEKMWEAFEQELSALIRDFSEQGLQADHIAEVLKEDAGE